MGDKQQINEELLNFQKEQAVIKYFKSKISEAIQELTNGKKNINNSITEFKKVYTGQAAGEKRTILESKLKDINSLIKELEQVLGDLNNKIDYLNHQTEIKETELKDT